MSIFESKKKREIRLSEEKIQLEQEKQMKVRETLRKLKTESSKFDRFKLNYIEKARNAKLVGNEQLLTGAKSGLKMCLSRQKFCESMIMQIELALNMKDMNKVIASFTESINVISQQLNEVSSNTKIMEASKNFETAMNKNLEQYVTLDDFINTSSEAFSEMSDIYVSVNDDEIDNLITNKAADSEDNLDEEIENKIKEVRQKIVE